MTWADHMLAVWLIALAPALSVWSASRLARKIESGDAGARIRFYAWGIGEYWTLALIVLTLWYWTDRPLEALGLVVPAAGMPAWITVGLCVATIVLLAAQISLVLVSEHARASARAQIEQAPGIGAVTPATAAEFRGFTAVAITAGVCEELFYRGFIMWYLSALLPFAWAVAAAVAIFGIGHAYQGLRGMVNTAVAGGIALAAYLVTGSLIAPVVMHAAIDFANGFVAYWARAERAASPLA
jgi:uncharacterized protein